MKLIKPKIMVNNEMLTQVEDIIKNRQSIELYEKYSSKNLIIWLYRSDFIDKETFIKYFNNDINDSITYYQFLKKLSIDIEKINNDFDTFDKLSDELKNNNIQSLSILYQLVSDFLKYEVYVIEHEKSQYESVILECMDNYLMVLIVLHMESKSHSDVFIKKIKKLMNSNLPSSDNFRLFENEVITSNDKHSFVIEHPFIMIDSEDVNLTPLNSKMNNENHDDLLDKYQVKDKVNLRLKNAKSFIKYIKVKKYE